MALDVNAVLEEAMALPEAERALVAAELLASIEDPDEDYSPQAADEFARELERRIERVASGESEGIGFDEGQRIMDEQLARG